MPAFDYPSQTHHGLGISSNWLSYLAFNAVRIIMNLLLETAGYMLEYRPPTCAFQARLGVRMTGTGIPDRRFDRLGETGVGFVSVFSHVSVPDA
jgi:hypothetical protein